MRTNYTIKSECNGNIEVVATETNKRNIESRFNRLMKFYRKDANCIVEDIRIGYSRVTMFTTYGSVEFEYWIAA